MSVSASTFRPSPSPLLESAQIRDYQKNLWNIVSAIIFPIGFYRLACYGIGKYVVSQAILPTSSLFWQNESLERQFTISTPDGVLLDAATFPCAQHTTTSPHEQRWVVFAMPNGALWQDLNFHQIDNINILCVNYRGTGHSTGRPSCFEDLYCDIDSAVQYLINQGVSPHHIALHGHSLGGASALHVAKNRNLYAIVQHTFSTTEAVPLKHIKSFIKNIYDLQTKNLPKFSTFLFSLKDAIFSLPHLCLRITYFFFSLFIHLFQRNIEEAKKDLIEIRQTLIIDILTTITGLISLIAFPFTNTFSTFNGAINMYFLEHSAICSFAQGILRHTGWNANNLEAANSLGNRVLVIQAPNDSIISYRDASLANALQSTRSRSENNIITLDNHATHCDILPLTHPRLFTFLTCAFNN